MQLRLRNRTFDVERGPRQQGLLHVSQCCSRVKVMRAKRRGGTRWTGMGRRPVKYTLPFGKPKVGRDASLDSTNSATTSSGASTSSPTTSASHPDSEAGSSTTRSALSTHSAIVGGAARRDARLSLTPSNIQRKRKQPAESGSPQIDKKRGRMEGQRSATSEKDEADDDPVFIISTEERFVSQTSSNNDDNKSRDDLQADVQVLEVKKQEVQVVGQINRTRGVAVANTMPKAEMTQISSASVQNSLHLDALPLPETFKALQQRLAMPSDNFLNNCTFTGLTGREAYRFRQLSLEIWEHFKNFAQSESLFLTKIRLWQELASAVAREVGGRLLVFGSTLSGFGSKESDVDICLVTQSFLTTGQVVKNQSIDILRQVRKCLRFLGNGWNRDMKLIPSAKVPILQIFHQGERIEVDINCNNVPGFRNTHLLFCYGQVDWRVRPLILTVKSWATEFGINDAKECTFSSYTLSLLCINFLQCGLKNPVLPSLQALHPQIFHSKSNISSLPFLEPLDTSAFMTSNTMSLGQLFTAFISYYSDIFDFTNDVASVRTAQRLHLRQCEDEARRRGLPIGQWRAYVAVEDPFELSNAGRAIINRQKFDDILRAFDRSKRLLSEGAKLMDLSP